MYDYLKEIPPGYKQEYKSLIGKVIPASDSVKYQLIIMAYKEENFIGECVESLTNQTISPDEFEVLIINNCSREEEFDNTESVVKENYKLMQLYSPSISVQTKEEIKNIIRNTELTLDKTNTDGMMLEDGISKTSWLDLFIAFKKIIVREKNEKIN